MANELSQACCPDVQSEAAAYEEPPRPFANAADDYLARSQGDALAQSLKLQPIRVFPEGTELTNRLLESGIQSGDLTADQLRLERNLIWRDAHPNATFNDPNLEAAIDCIKGLPAEPRIEANKLPLDDADAQNLHRLQNYESFLRTAEWRGRNPEQMVDAHFPEHLSNEQISASALNKVQDAINDLFAEKGMPFAKQSLREWYQKINQYQPNPRFEEKTALNTDERLYLDALVARRVALQKGESN